MKKLLYILLVLIMASYPSVSVLSESKKGDYVVLLHGIARSSSHMKSLEKYLAGHGYEVINIDYPSTDHSLEELVGIINTKLSTKLIENKPVHFVGYSMGGLLIRFIIHRHRPQSLGRVVQLAPPNNGSEVSDFFKNNWLYKKFYGPAGQELTTDQKNITNLLGKIDYELGIIAGNSTIDPICSTIIPGDDDGKVSIESTKLTGMKDHIIVPASHTFFPSNKIVHRQTEYFLKNGVFQKQAGK